MDAVRHVLGTADAVKISSGTPSGSGPSSGSLRQFWITDIEAALCLSDCYDVR